MQSTHHWICLSCMQSYISEKNIILCTFQHFIASISCVSSKGDLIDFPLASFHDSNLRNLCTWMLVNFPLPKYIKIYFSSWKVWRSFAVQVMSSGCSYYSGRNLGPSAPSEHLQMTSSWSKKTFGGVSKTTGSKLKICCPLSITKYMTNILLFLQHQHAPLPLHTVSLPHGSYSSLHLFLTV